jgi:hypothetical protein
MAAVRRRFEHRKSAGEAHDGKLPAKEEAWRDGGARRLGHYAGKFNTDGRAAVPAKVSPKEWLYLSRKKNPALKPAL